MKKALKYFLLIVWACALLAACSSGGGGGNAPAPLPSPKAITEFIFADPAATGVITETNHTISVTVPFGTIVTSLIPTITHTGASISPESGVAQDFTTPVVYTVTAADATTQDYTVTVIVPTGTPKTGQTACYNVAGDVIDCANTGQDGDLQKGVAWSDPRFTVGTGAETDCVTDNLTGLMWVKSPDSATMMWQQALDYANGLTLCGHSDWRLPNRKELGTLVNYGVSYSAAWLNTQGFSNVQGAGYWSSTTCAQYIGSAWMVGMNLGLMTASDKTVTVYVWPVRAGQ